MKLQQRRAAQRTNMRKRKLIRVSEWLATQTIDIRRPPWYTVPNALKKDQP